MGKKDVCRFALPVSKILKSKSCLKFVILKCSPQYPVKIHSLIVSCV